MQIGGACFPLPPPGPENANAEHLSMTVCLVWVSRVYLLPPPVQPNECTDLELLSFFGESGAFFQCRSKINYTFYRSVQPALCLESVHSESGVSSSTPSAAQ